MTPRQVASSAVKEAGRTAADASRDWFFLVMTGLGLTLSGAEFVGGVLLAIGGGAIAAHFRHGSLTSRERQAWWITILVAAFAGILAGQAAPSIAPGWPPQAIMGAAGFASRFLVKIALRTLGILEDRSDRLADRIADKILPDRDDK